MTPPLCPDCGEPMKLRESSRGHFWGCSAYPKCRGLVSISLEEQDEIQERLPDNTKTWKERFFHERAFWARVAINFPQNVPIHQSGIRYVRSECPCCGEPFKKRAAVELARDFINSMGATANPDPKLVEEPIVAEKKDTEF